MKDWLGPLATMLAMLIGVVLGHRLAIKRDNFTAKRNAAAKFRSSILSALEGLYPLPADWPVDIEIALRRAFPALQFAVEEYRPFVPWWRRWAYDFAWLKYRSATGRQIDTQCYLHYLDIQNIDEPAVDGKKAFRLNVDALLKFASTD